MSKHSAKLSKTQAELLEALQSGVILQYMPYAGWFNPTAYYFRCDNHKRCTAAAQALIDKGLAEKFDRDFRGAHKVRAKATGEQS